MSRPLNRAFIHRFTKGSVETVSDLAKGRDFMASNIRVTELINIRLTRLLESSNRAIHF